MSGRPGCPRCDGVGWILDTAEVDGHGDYRPCPDCDPELHDRFMDGHLASGHDCAECQARRGGRAHRGKGDDGAARVKATEATPPPPDPSEPLPLDQGIEAPF